MLDAVEVLVASDDGGDEEDDENNTGINEVGKSKEQSVTGAVESDKTK